jgi:type I restriction enzyme, R subunit
MPGWRNCPRNNLVYMRLLYLNYPISQKPSDLLSWSHYLELVRIDEPITEAGGGSVQEKQKALLNEIIQRVNDLFEGELTDQDKLVYVNNVIMGKLLESETLRQQAANNSKEQFANSPDLRSELMNAIIGALEAHTAMSTQALDSETVRCGIKDVLLGPARLYESLREQAADEALPRL